VADYEITGYAADRLRKDAEVAEARDVVEQNAGVESAFQVPESFDFPFVEDEAAVVEDFRAEIAAEQAAQPPAEGENPQPVDAQNPGDLPDPADPTIPEFNQ